ncbi:hypothetical protein E3A20_20840, partial [Planctomyces bekefii]
KNNAVGQLSLYFNTTGSNNTATGDSSLASNTTGSYNTKLKHWVWQNICQFK